MKSVVLPAACAVLGLVDLAWIDLRLAPALVSPAPSPAAAVAETSQTPAPKLVVQVPAPLTATATATANPVVAVTAAPPEAKIAPPSSSSSSEEATFVVYFDVDARDPKSGEIDVQKIAAKMVKAPVLRASIDGHTDHTGAPAHNEKLSRSRAEAVAEALVARGIEQDRIVLRGHGARTPVAPGDDADALARNRRVEVRLAEDPSSKAGRKPAERRAR